MDSFDKYSADLLEEAKRFLELAHEKGKVADAIGEQAFLHAALLISISSLEAFIYGISDEFKESHALNLHEKAFLSEKEIYFDKGSFKISNTLKMTRLIERIEFLFQKFKPGYLSKDSNWWPQLTVGIKLRNSIVHPKEFSDIKYDNVENTIRSVIECINQLFLAIYKKSFPGFSMGLDSKLHF